MRCQQHSQGEWSSFLVESPRSTARCVHTHCRFWWMISAQVEAYLVHLGAQEVGGAGGFADHQREEVLSTDLPYPKSGYYDKQQRCEDCEDGCPIWWLGKGWAVVLGVPVGLCVVGQIACRILYVAVIVPNERTDLVTKVLAMDTGMNFYTAMIGGVVMNIIHGEPIYLPPRGPAFIHLFIMGSPMWIGWLTSQKVWTDADADSEKDDSG